jgi:hypothetical protein
VKGLRRALEGRRDAGWELKLALQRLDAPDGVAQRDVRLEIEESVTAGSWPKWVTERGPTAQRMVATALSGTRRPSAART